MYPDRRQRPADRPALPSGRMACGRLEVDTPDASSHAEEEHLSQFPETAQKDMKDWIQTLEKEGTNPAKQMKPQVIGGS